MTRLLSIGVTLPDFHKVGKIPVLMTFTKMILKGRVILSPQSSIVRPEALLTFKLFMISKINCCVIAIVSRFEHVI